MKRTLTTLILAMALPLGLPALADMSHMSHGTASGHAAMGEMMAEGTVKKVDKAQGKITIQHGPLANLDMPPMTMIFRVQDSALLDRVKPGDNIRFQADKVNGRLTVTHMEAVR
ncbi:MAG: copper-binding protein [Thiobacillus sp.]|nr:copper-binding protein [Thiobacillus sp.]